MSNKATSRSQLLAQNPLLLRSHRLMEAFAKSDDERDFYLDRLEGFILYVDLDKPHAELTALERALKNEPERFCLIPKLTFYEMKKIMEGFVNEKVYDIDTKEKLLDIIGAKSARDNFLEFIYDHHSEQEKWQQYYQERSRIRIIEWLRKNHFQFVFEEDLDFTRNVLDKIKSSLFQKKAGKDVENARKALFSKAKTYYSNEALNPRPKRGRPPKQVAKQEIEPQVSSDLYSTVPAEVRPFLFTPEIGHAWLATFSSKFENEESHPSKGRTSGHTELSLSLENLNKKLESLRQISHRLVEKGLVKPEEVMNLSEEGNDAEDEWPVRDGKQSRSTTAIFNGKKAVPAPAQAVGATKKASPSKPQPLAAKPASRKVSIKNPAAKVKAKAPTKKATAKTPAAKKATPGKAKKR